MEPHPSELLNLPPDAAAADIKRAYRKAALALHPDQNPHPDAARRFRALTENYQRLLEKAPREPARRVPEQVASGLLHDLRDLGRRWTDQQWSRMVDGLPALVWAVGILQVVAATWPHAVPAAEAAAFRAALERWPPVLPAPRGLDRKQGRRLDSDLASAEARLARLRAPKRGASGGNAPR